MVSRNRDCVQREQCRVLIPFSPLSGKRAPLYVVIATCSSCVRHNAFQDWPGDHISGKKGREEGREKKRTGFAERPITAQRTDRGPAVNGACRALRWPGGGRSGPHQPCEASAAPGPWCGRGPGVWPRPAAGGRATRPRGAAATPTMTVSSWRWCALR